MKLKPLSRVLLLTAAILLGSSIFVAIWRIELSAPQYPEGLVLLIYANKLGGNVDIINGLNHYIGMQTLHAENFIEFTLLPYIIGFFALFTLIVSVLSNKKMLIILFASFVGFGIFAMVDFYRWNYNYGHNLDPNAAIIVPGMAYQPPLIGYKQLLNFGAFSIPDIGGWFFISAGLLLLIAVVLESKKWGNKNISGFTTFAFIGLIFIITSCNNSGAKQPKMNSTNCDFCNMTIADEKFVAQCITQKGKYYYFDDLVCLVKFKKENNNFTYTEFYVADFNAPQKYISLNDALLLRSEEIMSPMGGNIVAFSKQKDADQFIREHQVNSTLWMDLIK